MPKFLFLYTELAEYFLSCVTTLVQEHQAEVHIVRWPVNKEAPFKFKNEPSVKIYNKEGFTRTELLQLAQQVKPDLVFCSGWMDKDYLAVARSFHKTVPVLLGLDNHWYGTLKQQIGRLVAPFSLKRVFTHAFVAGSPQAVYASKLSFAPEAILQGYYAANVPVFQEHYRKSAHAKSSHFPKRFIYVGRYVPQKGLDTFWQAFKELQAEQPNDWELWCLGTGPLEQVAVQHPRIRHFGFVQPSQIAGFIGETGVFVLPSLFEPWGVVVHEFAAAGFPLICSDKVGAATAYLQPDSNGYTFRAGDTASLKAALKQVIEKPEHKLLEMGERSIELAMQNTPSIWANKLVKLLEEK